MRTAHNRQPLCIVTASVQDTQKRECSHGTTARGTNGATEIAGVDNVARAKKQGLKTREWTSRHEEAAVDIASGQRGMKKQGWTTREWTRRHEETGVDNAGVSDREK